MAKERIFAVVGLGTFGMEVCTALSAKGAKVIAMDNQKGLVERIKDTVTQGILIDTTDEDALKNVPLENVDVAVVAIGNNVESSILTTVLFREIGVPYILARAISRTHEHVLRQIGANEVINVEIDEGRRVAAELISPSILDRIPIDRGISVAEILVPPSFEGKTLRQLDLRNLYRINVVTVKRTEVSVDEMGNPVRKELVIFPNPDDVLQKGDVIIVIGKNEDIELLREF